MIDANLSPVSFVLLRALVAAARELTLYADVLVPDDAEPAPVPVAPLNDPAIVDAIKSIKSEIAPTTALMPDTRDAEIERLTRELDEAKFEAIQGRAPLTELSEARAEIARLRALLAAAVDPIAAAEAAESAATNAPVAGLIILPVLDTDDDTGEDTGEDTGADAVLAVAAVAPPPVPEAPVKRGPGRPRKHPLPDPGQPKRGPGRPSKNPAASVASVAPSADVAGATPGVKRGPGRPKGSKNKPKDATIAPVQTAPAPQAPAVPVKPIAAPQAPASTAFPAPPGMSSPFPVMASPKAAPQKSLAARLLVPDFEASDPSVDEAVDGAIAEVCRLLDAVESHRLTTTIARAVYQSLHKAYSIASIRETEIAPERRASTWIANVATRVVGWINLSDDAAPFDTTGMIE